MGQRQEQQQSTIWLHGDVRHGIDTGIGDEHEVRVGELDAFGRSRGAGSIYDGRQVGTFDGMFAFIEFRIGYGAAVFDDGIDRTEPNHIDVAQIRTLRTNRFDFVPLAVIFGKGHLDLRIVENHRDLCR